MTTKEFKRYSLYAKTGAGYQREDKEGVWLHISDVKKHFVNKSKLPTDIDIVEHCNMVCDHDVYKKCQELPKCHLIKKHKELRG